MSWPLPDDFPSKAALRDMVTRELVSTVTRILNYIRIEVSEGLLYPMIDKTGAPGPMTPWVIRIPAYSTAASITLSDANPSALGDSASPGASTSASRADHVHPKPALSTPATLVDDRTATEAAALSAIGACEWTRNGTQGLKKTVQVGTAYDHTAATPQLIALVQDEWFDADGRLYYQSPVYSYVVDQPTLETWGTA